MSLSKRSFFEAFNAWQDARSQQLFTKAQKESLRDPDYKFHLVRNDESAFTLDHIKETKLSESAGTELRKVTLSNPGKPQMLEFTLQFDGPVNGCTITPPGGGEIQCGSKVEKDQLIICKGKEVIVADGNRNKIAVLQVKGAGTLPKGDSELGVKIAGDGNSQTRFNLTYWKIVRSEKVGK